MRITSTSTLCPKHPILTPLCCDRIMRAGSRPIQVGMPKRLQPHQCCDGDATLRPFCGIHHICWSRRSFSIFLRLVSSPFPLTNHRLPKVQTDITDGDRFQPLSEIPGPSVPLSSDLLKAFPGALRKSGSCLWTLSMSLKTVLCSLPNFHFPVSTISS